MKLFRDRFGESLILFLLQVYNFIQAMSGLSLALKRKSVQKAEPILPKTQKNRQPSATGRTIYQNFKPSEVLKEFKKKYLHTFGNLSTQKSLSNLNTQEFVVMKQSRFDDDHHNTESIQQLLETKMSNNLLSSRSKIEQTNKKSVNSGEKLTSQKQTLQSQLLLKDESQLKTGQKQGVKQENINQHEMQGKQGQNYDDYVLGDKIEQVQEQEQTKNTNTQKYINDQKLAEVFGSTQSIARADYIHFQSQRKRLLQLKEDQEIIASMQKYKSHKQMLLDHTKRKLQTQRIMASISKPPRIYKSCSLPSIKAKRQVEVPEVESNNDEKTKRNLIAKGIKKQDKFSQGQLVSSLSSGKLGFGRKKIRTICEQDIYEDQMSSLQEIKEKLRSKGIVIDSNKLVKGLINIKNEFQYDKVVVYPQRELPSNPIYQKFPL